MKLLGVKDFPHTSQGLDNFCGVHTTWMVLSYYGHTVPFLDLGIDLKTHDKRGTSDHHVLRVFRSYGLRAGPRKNMTLADIGIILSCGGMFVAFTVKETHSIVVHGMTEQHVYIADPGYPTVNNAQVMWPETPVELFMKHWSGSGIAVTPGKKKP